MSPGEVRVAVIGNSFASKVQLPALRWAGGNRVVGLAGSDADKARRTARAWDVEVATDDWTELLALEPDLVLVSTPVHLHREMTLAALERGAAVLCEKPFALDAHEATELARAAAGKPAWLDHQLRWSPHVRALADRLGRGLVGEPWHARMELHLAGPGFRARPYGWWFDAARGGGMLGAIGSHLIDLTRFLLGPVRAVRCVLRTFVPAREDQHGKLHRVSADEHVALTLRLRSGVLVEVATSCAVPDDRRLLFQVTGADEVLRIDDDGRALRRSTQGQPFELLDVAPPPSAEEYGMQVDQGVFSRCLPLFLRDLVATVAKGSSDLPRAATFEDGLRVQRVLDAARLSAETGSGWVEVEG